MRIFRNPLSKCLFSEKVYSVHSYCALVYQPPPLSPSKITTCLFCQAYSEICKLSKASFLGNPQKGHSLFPSNPPLKTEVLSSPPFWKFGRTFNPPSRKWEGAHYDIGYALRYLQKLVALELKSAQKL